MEISLYLKSKKDNFSTKQKKAIGVIAKKKERKGK